MKKIISLAAALMIFMTSSVSAFTFPEPDWGKLPEEKKTMETELDFELYTEGSISSASYYGARLEPKSGTYIGMIAETSKKFQPVGSYLTYIEDMGQDDLYYPANEMIKNGNALTMVGWTIHDINNIDMSNFVERMLI